MTDVHDPTLGDLVAANPAAARVLERFGLDYCCRGGRTLADACAAAGIDATVVASDLDDLAVGGDTTWTTLDAPALADHIVDSHHRYLHEELPLIEALAAKVRSVHGERHPELADVARLVRALRADLEPHLLKEERVLFPAIHALAGGETEFPFGPVANPIHMMSLEHDRAGELLAELRAATDGYAVPDDGCASYRSLYRRLEALELDTHLHVHKENHVLFPAALQLADRRRAAADGAHAPT
jgi:regulator of cell morphogenesis and NO signaling